MNDVAQILDTIERVTIVEVARAVLNDPSVTHVDELNADSVDAIHNDQRALGIYRVTGTAMAPGRFDYLPWSAVLKIVDSTMEVSTSNLIRPELEDRIYRHRVLDGACRVFRPARCYQVYRDTNDHYHFWLEDLTSAPHPPWSLNQYTQVAYTLGRFHGYTILNPSIADGLDLARNNFVSWWKMARAADRIRAMLDHSDTEAVRKAITPQQLSLIMQTADRIESFLNKATGLPLCLSHGDSHARNLFPLQDETVAIDWSGASLEPLGSDLGVLLGSGLTWGINEQQMVINHLEDIYGKYIKGLSDAGWSGDLIQVRQGFFAQFGIYLCIIASCAWDVTSGQFLSREFFESRLSVSLDEVPGRLAALMPSITGYFQEFQLLARE